MRSTVAAGTEVIASCHAGVYVSGSSYPDGHVPGSPGRLTPYCARSRSNTVVTRCPATIRVGTPRRISPPPSPPTSNRGKSTATAVEPSPTNDSMGSISPKSKFHFPSPEAVCRKPSDPLGTRGSPVVRSSRTVFHAAPSAASSPPPPCARSAAVRNRSGRYSSVPSRCRRVTRKGRSVKRLT